MKRLIAAICAQMEDAILILLAVVQISGETHWCHVNVVDVIQDVKIAAIRKLVHMFLNLIFNFGCFGKKSQKSQTRNF